MGVGGVGLHLGMPAIPDFLAGGWGVNSTCWIQAYVLKMRVPPPPHTHPGTSSRPYNGYITF